MISLGSNLAIVLYMIAIIALTYSDIQIYFYCTNLQRSFAVFPVMRLSYVLESSGTS